MTKEEKDLIYQKLVHILMSLKVLDFNYATMELEHVIELKVSKNRRLKWQQKSAVKPKN
jgi:hypothetical protein